MATGATRDAPSPTVRVNNKIAEAVRADFTPAINDYVRTAVVPHVKRYLRAITQIGDEIGLLSGEIDQLTDQIHFASAVAPLELDLSHEDPSLSLVNLLPETFPVASLLTAVEEVNSAMSRYGIRFDDASQRTGKLAQQVQRATSQIRAALTNDAIWDGVVDPIARRHGLMGGA